MQRLLFTQLALLLSLCVVRPLVAADSTPAAPQPAQPTNSAPVLTNGVFGPVSLTLTQFLQMVLERNESVQLRVLELEINNRRYQAEKGVFEPDFVVSASREENKRENTAEQRRSLRINVFEEKNNIYSGGIEALVPSGAKVKLAYTMRDLNNNLQQPRIANGTISTNFGNLDEFQSFAGVTLTQPLLKNFGYTATMANIRLAALASDIAYEEYRRQLMETVATAEAAYWNLFMAQEQVRFFEDSVGLAQSIVNDNRVKLQAGKGSDLEVMEAEAGLALRQTKLADAVQKRQEAEMRLLTLYSDPAFSAHPPVRAADRPRILPTVPDFLASAATAFDLNPDYKSQQKKMKQEDIRVAYAKNQFLPELDLHASYGLNGLGDTPAASHADLENFSYPSFSVGLELHIPLGGNIKARNELIAARLRKQQAILTLKQAETQIINAVQTAVQKIRSARDAAESNVKVVDFHQNLLQTELERLNVGKVESRKVLETEAALFEARNAYLDSTVQYERARLELQLVQGTTLKLRDLDYSQSELQDRTALLIYRNREKDPEYQALMRSLYATPPAKHYPPITADEAAKARAVLRENLEKYQPPPAVAPDNTRYPFAPLRPQVPPRAPLPTEDLENARRELRDKLNSQPDSSVRPAEDLTPPRSSAPKTTPPKSE